MHFSDIKLHTVHPMIVGISKVSDKIKDILLDVSGSIMMLVETNQGNTNATQRKINLSINLFDLA